ncbi:hypothetical protein [Candidatus Enterovibrio altilux]|uniref:Mobile element protein n=1 Tax=Candidatus Enterovibrio altilux TaxID=1927128 RepID=A0A291B6W7_9GAMM|nr:hypothetical protein [Candidatus Enterovibrio luxaltus]ATF08741.1 Mobile element protein [Candidatus Enterovibrio luxaltus]
MSYPYYSCISKRIQMVNTMFKTTTKGIIYHLVIKFIELKVYGERE